MAFISPRAIIPRTTPPITTQPSGDIDATPIAAPSAAKLVDGISVPAAVKPMSGMESGIEVLSGKLTGVVIGVLNGIDVVGTCNAGMTREA